MAYNPPHPEHRDIAGNTIRLGDTVASPFGGKGALNLMKVASFTPKGMQCVALADVPGEHHGHKAGATIMRFPNQIAVVQPAFVHRPGISRPEVLHDEYGMPTEAALLHLENFEGPLTEMIQLVKDLYRVGGGSVETETVDQWNRKYLEIDFITGGFSGVEQTQSVLDRTLFNFGFWKSSSRGGSTVYSISHTQLEKNESAQWGRTQYS